MRMGVLDCLRAEAESSDTDAVRKRAVEEHRFGTEAAAVGRRCSLNLASLDDTADLLPGKGTSALGVADVVGAEDTAASLGVDDVDGYLRAAATETLGWETVARLQVILGTALEAV